MEGDTMTTTPIAERVRAGSEYLDKKYPKWWTKINADGFAGGNYSELTKLWRQQIDIRRNATA